MSKDWVDQLIEYKKKHWGDTFKKLTKEFKEKGIERPDIKMQESLYPGKIRSLAEEMKEEGPITMHTYGKVVRITGEIDLQAVDEERNRLEGLIDKKYFDSIMIDQAAGYVTSSVAHAPVDVCLESLMETLKDHKRKNFVYVIADKYIPDDACGILIVRPEDVKRFKK